MTTQTLTPEEVYEALRDVYDPEIPVNVVDLGLIYGVEVDEGNVGVTMTLTFAVLRHGTLHRAAGRVAHRRA